MQSGLVTNIQRYSTQDGPGIRTTVFLKGCPLDCWWCHNPEGRSGAPEVVVQETRCVRCGECIKVCPAEDTGSAGDAPLKPGPECTLCGACVEACPTGARQMTGGRNTVEEVLNEVLKDSIFYDDSGGGVTFSGGEPLMQAGFLNALLQACRSHGIRTAVDTCGYAPRESLMALAESVDLFLYDLKFLDEARHIEYTGVSNAIILSNLRELGAVHRNIWLRIPLIPALNDTEDQLDAMARLAASIPGVRQVNLLPYHRTGVQKFKRLGQDYRLAHVQPPSTAQMEAAVARFHAFGLNARSGG
jgi:pyruvate formate lyase activating enzyme